MAILPNKKKAYQSYALLPPAFIPDELISEILSFLTVKTIVRLKCVSKSWNTLISDQTFVQKHFNVSSQNPHLALFWHQPESCNFNVVPYPVYRVLKNPSINLIQPINYQCQLVGSCNGLLCLRNYSNGSSEFSLWNPATRKISKNLGWMWIPYRNHELGYFDFTFGYDASTRDYKVVAFRGNVNEGSWKSEVKVFSVGDNCWRNIQSFPVVVLFNRFDARHLTTETYKQFLMPPGFDDEEVPLFKPVLRVLMDCLCFSHDSNKTEFVFWQMKQYGVQESWTQLFKISYPNLQMHNIDCSFQLACLYVNGDMVIFASHLWRLKLRDQAFIYNLKDKTVERIKCRNSIKWFYNAKDYVESLVSVL
ncbi:unnamed protein product [Trifolium pratense]|uniref:Uncharacterized protein n=1 Tax=Trifolium pratense TaxID=57577 RepID=A0ACB0LN05_TRIPR|nr:unnamed protein product [Trifolium pratense]